MLYSSEEVLNKIIKNISSMTEVQSIGISGNKFPLPKAFEGDIDIFIYCDKIPDFNERQVMLIQSSNLLKDYKINVFEGGNWGVGDLVYINGIETWLMYFTINETITEIEAILNGEYPDKLNNYYYPIGRCAMIRNISIYCDKNNFLSTLKYKLSEYPEKLAKILMKYHLNQLEDTEDLERAVLRKDVLFYHFALDIAIDHFLQALFAINRTFFPSRKRSLEYIENFKNKPIKCSEKLLEVIKLGSCSEGLIESYEMWINIVNDLKKESGYN